MKEGEGGGGKEMRTVIAAVNGRDRSDAFDWCRLFAVPVTVCGQFHIKHLAVLDRHISQSSMPRQQLHISWIYDGSDGVMLRKRERQRQRGGAEERETEEGHLAR